MYIFRVWFEGDNPDDDGYIFAANSMVEAAKYASEYEDGSFIVKIEWEGFEGGS